MHIFKSILYTREAPQIPGKHHTPRVGCTIQHLTDGLASKHHWSHDLHLLAERFLTFITFYKFLEREEESNPGRSNDNF